MATKVKIVYEIALEGGPFPCAASGYNANGTYISGSYSSGRTWGEARQNLIAKLTASKLDIPPPEEVEL